HICHYVRRFGKTGLGINNESTAGHLVRAEGYEITGIMDTAPDWGREKERPPPKRPPHEKIWVAGQHRDTDGANFTDWTLGTLIAPFAEKTRTEFAECFRNGNSLVITAGGEVHEDNAVERASDFLLQPGFEYYQVQMFTFVNRFRGMDVHERAL